LQEKIAFFSCKNKGLRTAYFPALCSRQLLATHILLFIFNVLNIRRGGFYTNVFGEPRLDGFIKL
jgi:hypothetical protein